jgi:hypothetical protein
VDPKLKIMRCGKHIYLQQCHTAFFSPAQFLEKETERLVNQYRARIHVLRSVQGSVLARARGHSAHVGSWFRRPLGAWFSAGASTAGFLALAGAPDGGKRRGHVLAAAKLCSARNQKIDALTNSAAASTWKASCDSLTPASVFVEAAAARLVVFLVKGR